MKIEIPDLKLETKELCTECWGSSLIDHPQNIKISIKCPKCKDGYTDEITDFGRELLNFMKKYFKVS